VVKTGGPAQLPDGLALVRRTPEFTDTSVPAGLLEAHKVARGVWGNLVLIEGSLDFVFEAEEESRETLVAPASQPIPPLRPHRVVVTGPARFLVEFYRYEAPS